MNTVRFCVELINDWIFKKKTGNIKINFFQGGISNVNLEESVKPVIKERPKDN